MQSVQDLLQALVKLPSVNPDGNPDDKNTGEGLVVHFLDELLTSWGFRVTQEEIQPGRANLIARSPGPENRPRILLGPHSDTVGVSGMTIDPFGAEIRDGRLWGRGASDTKGPMAAMLWGLHENLAILPELPVAVDFVAFMGEETAQEGSRHFAKDHAKDYEFALVGEPTGLHFVHTTKGSLWATLSATGKAAHSSQPELGENAILKLSRSLDLLNRKLSGRLATFTHPVLGHANFNVGTIRGGTRPNVVPDQASAEIDIRTVPALAEAGGALQLLEEVIAEFKLPLHISNPHENPPMEVPTDNPWLARFAKTLPESQLVGAPWFSDAAHLSKGGIPAVCIGPGSIDQAHTADEFITLDDLAAGADYFTRLIASLKD